MVHMNLSEGPNFTRPEILLHPIIPRSLTGINPRGLKGQEWWDVTRKEAYAKNNYCCSACGITRLDTRGQLLDGHEFYEYDFTAHTIAYVEAVALCRSCHEFIHFDTLMAERHRRSVLEHGLEVLKAAGLQPPSPQFHEMRRIMGLRDLMRDDRPLRALILERWTLVFEGEKYR